MERYALMNKDRRLAIFHLELNGEFVIDESYGVPSWAEEIGALIHYRFYPPNRKNMEELLMNLTIRNTHELITKTYMVGLNDCLWVKLELEDTKWEQVSPYGRPLNQEIFKASLWGRKISNKEQVETISPEFSSRGMFDKGWARRKGRQWLIKRSSPQYNSESFSEYYVSQIEKAMGLRAGLDYVEYDVRLKKDDSSKGPGISYSVCKSFTNEKYGFLPAVLIDNALAYKPLSVEHPLLGLKQGWILRVMMVLDCITANYDRHPENYGVIIDNSSLEVLGIAPIFDNNLALAPTAKTGVELVEFFNSRKPHNSEMSFGQQADEFMDDRTYEMVRRLRGFEFDRSGKYNLDRERLDILERLIDIRVTEILSGYKSRRGVSTSTTV